MTIYQCKRSGCWVARIGNLEFASRVSRIDAMCGAVAMFNVKRCGTVTEWGAK